MGKITPCLWFDGRVDDAIEFYRSIFPDFKVGDIQRYGEGSPFPAGTILLATIEIAGQSLMILNGGPYYKLTEAFSLFVRCENQEEVDYYWDRLIVGGEPSQCGWLKDPFGVSWQIVPNALGELLGDPDQARAGRVMQAMLQMVKIDVRKLQEAADRSV